MREAIIIVSGFNVWSILLKWQYSVNLALLTVQCNLNIREIIRRSKGRQKTTMPLYYFNIASLTILVPMG